jgi:predicted dehydrogenase
MNAGFIPLDHWVHGPEGGGRNIGEACHIYDLFHHLVGEPVSRVDAVPIGQATDRYARNDNFTATLRFEDGSIATLHYTALGSKALAKERLEVFAEGGAAVLDDYRELELHGFGVEGVKVRGQDKGHLAELEAFAAAVRGEAPWPIPLWQQLDTTRISFRVERLIEAGGADGAEPGG